MERETKYAYRGGTQLHLKQFGSPSYYSVDLLPGQMLRKCASE